MMALLTREEVHARLQAIFPDGTPNRAYITRMLAARTLGMARRVAMIWSLRVMGFSVGWS